MNKEILEKKYQKVEITKENLKWLKQNILRYPEKFIGTSIRVIMGNIYTDDEFRKRSDYVLSKKLPDEHYKPKNNKILKLLKKISKENNYE